MLYAKPTPNPLIAEAATLFTSDRSAFFTTLVTGFPADILSIAFFAVPSIRPDSLSIFVLLNPGSKTLFKAPNPAANVASKISSPNDTFLPDDVLS